MFLNDKDFILFFNARKKLMVKIKKEWQGICLSSIHLILIV